jgi:hypothetical protein
MTSSILSSVLQNLQVRPESKQLVDVPEERIIFYAYPL